MGVSKFHNNKQILKDISLSYFYGAKIGVLGLNGSGKSSLLRILAGVDRDFIGESLPSPGYSVGFLEQEPQLDEEKTVREIVEEGAGETVELLDKFNEISAKFAEPMDDDEMNEPSRGAGQDPGEDRPHRRMGSRLEARYGDGRPALPASGHADQASYQAVRNAA